MGRRVLPAHAVLSGLGLFSPVGAGQSETPPAGGAATPRSHVCGSVNIRRARPRRMCGGAGARARETRIRRVQRSPARRSGRGGGAVRGNGHVARAGAVPPLPPSARGSCTERPRCRAAAHAQYPVGPPPAPVVLLPPSCS